jgi:AcrR family transcriptional regulator
MAYRTTASRIERDQVLREHILDCAVQQVADGGFSSLTMSTLARSAGVATGSLYRHFAGKGDLAASVFVKATRLELDTLKQQFQAPGRAVDRLRNGLTQRLYFRQAYATLYGELIAEGIADGSFQVENIPLTSACVVGAVAESLVGPLSPQARADRESGLPSETLEAVTLAIVRFCLRAINAKEVP